MVELLNNRLQEGKDFILYSKEEYQDTYCIKLISGPYSDVVYFYDVIKIEEDAEKGEARLNFSHQIIQSPEDIITDETHFLSWIATILHEILTTFSDSDMLKIQEENGGTSDDDS